ncbi:uncharacterized protein LOC110825630 [Carica papaya]|uniref:uncharacterized protein LOC110825630 n=1 Tax=Carica papaya TaxID=3649 RepID=UPI000B8C7BE7|nr:uncharacterized protein LOC110825630 [Carica papaya]
MEEEKDAVYVVRKGDTIAVYKSLSDCQAQTGSSVCTPSMSVYKRYGLSKEAEEFLASHGLKNPAYAINASYVKEDLFGELLPCPFQEPYCSKAQTVVKDSPPKRSQEQLHSNITAECDLDLFLTDPQKKHLKVDNCIQLPIISPTCQSCIIEFDGASKGNPGPAGAGAVLRTEDGSLVYLLREGVGIATNNVAEYRAVILGLKCALRKGFKHVTVRGDSKLVCMQIQGLWKIKNPNMAELCKQAVVLKDKFTSFHIFHVEREFNSTADAQANLAVNLRDGQVEESCK